MAPNMHQAKKVNCVEITHSMQHAPHELNHQVHSLTSQIRQCNNNKFLPRVEVLWRSSFLYEDLGLLNKLYLCKTP
jgi:hypothetical protein